MALLPNIMSLFGGRTPDPTPPNPQANPAVATSQAAAAATNPTVPGPGTPGSDGTIPGIPATATGPASPVDNFADLWKTDPNNKPVPPASLVPTFNLEPAKIMEMAKGINFTQHIPAEQVTKALSGDATAFMEVINQAVQLGFANATMTNGKIIENSLTSAQGALTNQVLPSAFREREISRAIDSSNPVFQDPAVAPMLNSLKQQLQTKYPTAGAEEIAGLATQYLTSMSNKIVSGAGGTVIPKGAQAPGNQSGFAAPKDEDWSKYFGVS